MSNIPEGCKPFNLQDALAGKPVVTRDGRQVKIAGYNPEVPDKSQVVLGWAEGDAMSWGEDGLYIDDDENPKDIFMAPETKDVWVVIFESINKDIISSAYETEKEAQDAVKGHHDYGEKTFGIHKITINQ